MTQKEINNEQHFRTLDEYLRRMRELAAPRFYKPRITPVLQAMEDGNIMPGSLRVMVKDGWCDFPEGSLPSQTVKIQFDYIRLRKDKGEIPFDREMKEQGYLPE